MPAKIMSALKLSVELLLPTDVIIMVPVRDLSQAIKLMLNKYLLNKARKHGRYYITMQQHFVYSQEKVLRKIKTI